MGLFNWVNVALPCPKCGAMLRHWQSKDYTPHDMALVEADDVDRFYNACNKCNTWAEFAREPKEAMPTRPVAMTIEQVMAIGFKQILPPPEDQQ